MRRAAYGGRVCADDGRWSLRVVDGELGSRRYQPDTFVLETVWRAPGGRARVLDLIPPGDGHGDLVRLVEGLEGEVEVEHDLRI